MPAVEVDNVELPAKQCNQFSLDVRTDQLGPVSNNEQRRDRLQLIGQRCADLAQAVTTAGL